MAILLLVLLLFIPLVILFYGCGGGGSGSTPTGASSSYTSTSQKLPPETLKFIEEEAKRNEEFLDNPLLNDSPQAPPDYSGMVDQAASLALTSESVDLSKYVFFPDGPDAVLYYGDNGIPYKTTVGTPLMRVYHSPSKEETLKQMPLPAIMAKKAHFLVSAGWSVNESDGAHIATVRIYYKDGTSSFINLILGQNIAEWAYDRPENQGKMRHSPVTPYGNSWWTNADSASWYWAHNYYVCIDLAAKELDRLELLLEPITYPNDGWILADIASMTLEVSSLLSIENFTADPPSIAEGDTTTITGDIVQESPDWTPINLRWSVNIYASDTQSSAGGTSTRQAGMLVYSFPIRFEGNYIHEVWDGRDNQGNFVSDGNYRAECIAWVDNPGVYPAYASTTVAKDIATLRVRRITFQGSWDLHEANNNKLDVFWEDGWEFKGVAYSRTAKKAKMEVSFEFRAPRTKTKTFGLNVVSKDNTLNSVMPVKVEFPPGTDNVTKTFEINLPQSIQKVDKLYWLDELQGLKVVATANLKAEHYYGGIYIMLDQPKDVMKHNLRIEPLYVGCTKAGGKSKPEDAIEVLVDGVWNYLRDSRIAYAGEAHLYGGNDGWDIFKLTNFLNEGQGDCKDCAVFFQLACNAIGADIDLSPLTPKYEGPIIDTHPVQPFFLPGAPDSFIVNPGVRLHAVCCDNGRKVFDPTYHHKNAPMIVNGNEGRIDYTNHLVFRLGGSTTFDPKRDFTWFQKKVKEVW